MEYESLVVILQSSLSSYAGKYADSGFDIDGRGIAPEGAYALHKMGTGKFRHINPKRGRFHNAQPDRHRKPVIGLSKHLHICVAVAL